MTNPHWKSGDPRQLESARKGGRTSAERRRHRRSGIYTGSIFDIMAEAALDGPTWAPWRVFLKAIFGLPMDDSELEIFRRHTEREQPPGSANPDTEVLAALRPGMAMVPDSLLLALSSPYATRGELYRAHSRYFGQDDPFTLIWNADSRSMNSALPEHVIERAFENDPIVAASEYGIDGRVQFRRDVEAFLDVEAVNAVTIPNRKELPRAGGVQYVAFVDPSGGRADSFTIAIAHAVDETAVLDVIRERRPPFSPDDVVKEYAELLKSYGIQKVTGDKYAGEWPRERFRAHGITYEPSDRTKSDIYREFVAPINAARVELLDLPLLRAQLVGLERRVARGGRDSIDHAPGGHDDIANAAAGALTLVSVRAQEYDDIPLSESYYSIDGAEGVPVRPDLWRGW